MPGFSDNCMQVVKGLFPYYTVLLGDESADLSTAVYAACEVRDGADASVQLRAVSLAAVSRAGCAHLAAVGWRALCLCSVWAHTEFNTFIFKTSNC